MTWAFWAAATVGVTRNTASTQLETSARKGFIGPSWEAELTNRDWVGNALRII